MPMAQYTSRLKNTKAKTYQHKKLSVIFKIEHEERTECIHGYYFQYIITFKHTVKLSILKSNLSPHFQLLPLAI